MEDQAAAEANQNGNNPMLEEKFVDAGNVLILVGDPATGKAVPMPLPVVFEQLFGILGDIDRRLLELENKGSKIITL